MNSFQRYMAMIEGKPCDILPRAPILMAFAAQYIGSNYGAFASDYRVLVEANRRCAQDFGFDQLSAISDPYRETTGFGGEVEFIKNGVPRLLTPPLGDTKDLGVLANPDPETSPRMLDRIRAIREMAANWQKQYSILGWVEGPGAEGADLRGVTNFLFDLMDDPGFAHELMERCVEVGVDFAKAQLEAGADTIGIGDAIVSQVSPRMYEELIFPHQKRLIDEIKQAGGLVRLHICGDISHLLPQIKHLDLDILDLDNPVDMVSAREIFGPDQVLVANLDPVRDVQNGTAPEIERKLRRLYEAVGGRFMLGAGCEVPADTPHENLKALCTAIPFK